MQPYPEIPDVDAPGAALEGHLWIQELVDAFPIRFQLRDDGVVRFGDDRRVFDDPPPAYRHAVRHVREELDRAALRAAVDDVETVTFVGWATHRRAVDYDWGRLPNVLGVDVHDEDRGSLLPPDDVERVYDTLGLASVNAVRKEVRASDFEASADAIPGSAWYDGPAAGVVLRTKTGDRAKLRNPSLDRSFSPDPLEADAATLAERFATDDLLRGVAADGAGAAADGFFDRVYEAVLRRHHGRLCHPRTDVDLDGFRSALARRVNDWRGAQS